MSSMAFNLLPSINEADEQLCLEDILTLRDGPLTEIELWSVCRLTVIAVIKLQSSCEMFETLCITPDNLVIDALTGSVSFLKTNSGMRRIGFG